MDSVRVDLSAKARETLLQLRDKNSKIEQSILRSVENKVVLLKLEPSYGDAMKKNLIPLEYIIEFEVSNLFRIELANYWRMLYTLKKNESELIVFIIDILSHPDYDKKFGY